MQKTIQKQPLHRKTYHNDICSKCKKEYTILQTVKGSCKKQFICKFQCNKCQSVCRKRLIHNSHFNQHSHNLDDGLCTNCLMENAISKALQHKNDKSNQKSLIINKFTILELDIINLLTKNSLKKIKK